MVHSILKSPNEGAGAYFMFQAQANLHDDPRAEDYLSKLQPEAFVTFGVNQSYPFSRGSVHITFNDASEAPKIDPCYLDNPLDLEIFARHLQYLEVLVKTPPIFEYIEPRGKRNHPSASTISDLEAAKDYIRTTAITNYHAAGSCPLLPRENRGVVDERLMVYGTTNLRIVDASIFPVIPRGNIQSTVYAVAERAADLVKEDWGLSKL